MSIVMCKRCKRVQAVYYTVPNKMNYICDKCIKKSLGSSEKVGKGNKNG